VSDPKVTILICTFNGASTIAAAIESALAQKTKMPFEVFVVDDGSTDETAGIVRHMSEHDQRIWMKYSPRNSGLAFACNDGVKFADGDYFIRLDDDDLLHPDALESLCPMLNAGLADCSYCDRLSIDTETGVRRHIAVGPAIGPGWLSRLSDCGVMMRRDLFMELGGYRDIFWSEYDLYLRYLAKSHNPIRYVARPLYICAARPYGDNAKMREGWKELAGLWGEEKLREHGLGV